MCLNLPVSVMVSLPRYGQSSLPTIREPDTKMLATRKLITFLGSNTRAPDFAMVTLYNSLGDSSTSIRSLISTLVPALG